MNKKTLSLILNIIKIILSIALSITAIVSMLSATLISVGREYMQSEQFHAQVDSADLSAEKFIVDGEKVTVGGFIRQKASDYLADKMPSFSPFSNYAVDKVITSELVNTTVKREVYNLINYFLNTSVEEAKYRIENNITLQNNEELNIKNAETPEETISIYTRLFVLENIETSLNMSTDNLIIILSEQTVIKLITLSVVLLIALVIINITTIFNTLLYGGAISFLYGFVIKMAQSKFDELNAGMEDLVFYVFLKPLADAYSSNAIVSFIIGIILIALFVGVYFLFKNFVNKKEEQ